MTTDDSDNGIDRRTYIKGVSATSAIAGVGGLSAMSTPAQAQAEPDEGETTVAEFCGTFSPGAQVQQCIACVEDECDDGEVNSLTPLFTGLSGTCFTPDGIPDDADYVTLKAGVNCYLAPVGDNTTFCLPPGAPEISNATFYRCGGEEMPALIGFEVTCEEITIETDDIDEGETLMVTVGFVGDVSMMYNVLVDDVGTIALPGDLDPSSIELDFEGETLFEGNIQASDSPCAEVPPEPPKPPEPPEPDDKKELKKRMKEHKAKYEKYKKKYKKHE